MMASVCAGIDLQRGLGTWDLEARQPAEDDGLAAEIVPHTTPYLHITQYLEGMARQHTGEDGRHGRHGRRPHW